MTAKEFSEFFDRLCHAEQTLLTNKGLEYSGNENRFRNFEALGNELKLDKKLILWVYLKKHLDAIRSYITGDYAGSESIIGRIMDARNYLALLAGMIEEEGKKDN
jgi:hypothetical protein